MKKILLLGIVLCLLYMGETFVKDYNSTHKVNEYDIRNSNDVFANPLDIDSEIKNIVETEEFKTIESNQSKITSTKCIVKRNGIETSSDVNPNDVIELLRSIKIGAPKYMEIEGENVTYKFSINNGEEVVDFSFESGNFIYNDVAYIAYGFKTITE